MYSTYVAECSKIIRCFHIPSDKYHPELRHALPRFHIARLSLAFAVTFIHLVMETKFCFLSFFFSSDFPLLIRPFFANCYMISVVSFLPNFLLFYFEVFHAFFLFLSLLLPALPPAFQSLPQANSWQNYLVGHSQVQTVRGAKPLPLKRRQKRIPKRSPKKRRSPKRSRIQSRKGKRKCAVHRSVLQRAPQSLSTLGRCTPMAQGGLTPAFRSHALLGAG